MGISDVTKIVGSLGENLNGVVGAIALIATYTMWKSFIDRNKSVIQELRELKEEIKKCHTEREAAQKEVAILSIKLTSTNLELEKALKAIHELRVKVSHYEKS